MSRCLPMSRFVDPTRMTGSHKNQGNFDHDNKILNLLHEKYSITRLPEATAPSLPRTPSPSSSPVRRRQRGLPQQQLSSPSQFWLLVLSPSDLHLAVPLRAPAIGRRRPRVLVLSRTRPSSSLCRRCHQRLPR